MTCRGLPVTCHYFHLHNWRTANAVISNHTARQS